MAVETAASFLEGLAKSKILKNDQLAVAREAAAKAADAKTLARVLVQKDLLNRWQAGQLLAGRTSFLWGKYRLVDLLGRGGMGSVFLAWHTMMNRSVALKVISKELGSDSAALERFFTEARAVAALDHPNIVHAYDVANEGERYYLVMEYVEGLDLQRIVESKGPLDFALAVDYVRQAAEGLAHAHSKGMIHCDIKPANLLVNPQGVVKILDMGMARAVGRKAQDEAAEGAPAADQAILGTVDYMPPEHALGIEKLDRRSDIYSLGCTFYFALAGRPPFPEGTLAERIVKHQTQDPRDIAEFRSDAPPELIRICGKMMAKEPDDRFQTADELAQVLAEWRPSATKILRATPLGEGEDLEAAPAVEAETAEAAPAAETASVPKAASRVPLGATLAARAKGWVDYVLADRRRMMIWGGASGAAVLLAVCGLMWWIVSSVRTAKQQYAQQQAAAAKAAAAKPKPVADGNFGEFNSRWDEPAADHGVPEKTASDAPAPAPASKPVSPPPKPGAPPPKPGEPPPKPGAPSSPPTASPAPSPTTPAAAKPAVATPAAPPDSKAPAPAPPPAAAQKTAPANPPAEPAAPVPATATPADALTGFPAFVELPPIGEANAGEFAAGPTLLGKVQGPVENPITIELIGKDTALKGKRQFLFEQKEGDEKAQTWLVRIEATGKEEGQIEVARFVRDKDGLKFQWADGAAGAMGDYLRNCALDLRGGGPAHVVALRKAEIVDPVAFDLQKGINVASIPIESLPDAANLRIELVKVESPAGPLKIEYLEGPVFKPSNTMTIKTPTSLSFFRKDLRDHQIPGVEFTVTAVPKGKGLAITLRLATPSAQQYKSLLAAVAARRQEAELKTRGIPQQFAGTKDEGQKAKIAEDFEKWYAPLWYEEFYRQVHRNARLHFRVFIEAKDQRIELARTEMPK